MQVRPATRNDLAAIVRIYHSVWHETHARHMPAEEVRARSTDFFYDRMNGLLPTTVVAERARIVGFAAWRGATLGQIFVDPEERGTGLAAALLAGAERVMRTAGIDEAELLCVVGNERARAFYQRNGWRFAEVTYEVAAGSDAPVQIPFWRLCKTLL